MSNIKSFPISPDSLGGSPAAFRRPREIACFSYDTERVYRPDSRSLKYYYPAPEGTNLSRGFESFRAFDDSQDEHLESLLKTLQSHEKKLGVSCKADFITWRGMLTKIMTCPFDNDSFEMNATKFQGTIFIEENHPFKQSSRESQNHGRSLPGMPSQEMMSYWGYKFETVSTLNQPWDATARTEIETRGEIVVENFSQYCSVVETGIGNLSLIIGGEVDAVWDRKPLDPEDSVNWVELKTTALIENERDVVKYERKLLKYFVQSFLLGVPRIIVGMRDKRGILRRVEELETLKIPASVKRIGRGSWDGTKCLNFTAKFLIWVQNVIDGDGVWRIRRASKSSSIEIFKVEPKGSGTVLSDAFVDWRLAHGVVND